MQLVKSGTSTRPFRTRGWPGAIAGLWGIALLLAGSAANAYVPPLEAIYEQLVAGAPSAGSAILDLQCRVFNITQLDASGQPAADAARTFRQRVYWVRGKFLGVDTMADDGTVLHVALWEGGFIQSAQVVQARRFSDADVRPLIFPFLEGKTAAWTDELTYWGITPNDVDLVLLKSVHTFRMTETQDKALWVDREFGRPLKLSTRIEGGAGAMLLTVEFSDFISFASKAPEKDRLRIPRRFTYALDGKVFKDVYVTEYEVDPPARKFPLARLRQQVATNTARAQ